MAHSYLRQLTDARDPFFAIYLASSEDCILPNLRGAGIPVATQTERAEAYERYTTQALSLPFVVGLHWFQYTDQPFQSRAHDGENSNYGLVTIEDEPYVTLVEKMRQVNAQAATIAGAARLS
jgi:hypothetical protein